jgi:hypothetical protein
MSSDEVIVILIGAYWSGWGIRTLIRRGQVADRVARQVKWSFVARRAHTLVLGFAAGCVLAGLKLIGVCARCARGDQADRAAQPEPAARARSPDRRLQL